MKSVFKARSDRSKIDLAQDLRNKHVVLTVGVLLNMTAIDCFRKWEINFIPVFPQANMITATVKPNKELVHNMSFLMDDCFLRRVVPVWNALRYKLIVKILCA